jgi:glycosyltransferase involved in cell wall biosynthesis
MRIGFVVAGGVGRGGEVRVVPEMLDLLQELSRRNEVHVVALRQESRPGAWRVAGVDVWNVGSRPRRLRALLHLQREHRRSPFDVLVGYALVPQGALAGVAGRLLGIPVVAAAPGGDFMDMGDIDFGGWRNARGRFWVRLACRTAAAVVVPSTASLAMAQLRGVWPRRIPLPLSHDTWPRRDGGEPPVPARLVWIGSLNRVKAPELFVETVGYLREQGVVFAVDVVGGDFRDGAIARQVRAANLEPWVTFHGHLPQTGVRTVLNRASVLVVTSRFEGGSRVVLEAASVCVPTVGTRVGYVDEWSPDAAVAVDHATPQSLGDAVRTLLNNPEQRERLGRRARARLVEHDAASVAAEWESLLGEVAARGDRD